MEIKEFMAGIQHLKINFFTGVPDSQLKALCDFLTSTYGIGSKHIVAANEGAAVGLATGHFLASGHPALVYMQNSGIGNAVNPICSLINEKVYAIPVLFVIGWRGEPGVKDEPQHLFQGEITTKLLECLEIPYFVCTTSTTQEVFWQAVREAENAFAKGKSFAFLIRKNALEQGQKTVYENSYSLTREAAIEAVLQSSQESDVFVSTTGKLSRELFELREKFRHGHGKDFLTVGSMGHASMIALGIALEKRERLICCLDGDGALLMHMGSMAILGASAPSNLLHILINNGAHETVGGIPTVSKYVEYGEIAKACGYKNIFCACDLLEIEESLKKARSVSGPSFLEIRTNLFSRKNLGRPTTTPLENKEAFMTFLEEAL